MDLNEINGAASFQRRQSVKLYDLPKDERILIEGIKIINTKFGKTVLVELSDNRQTFLPKRVLGPIENNLKKFISAIPIIYILLTVPHILPWSQADLSFLAWCHIAGILCPWIGSFIYHLFMNLRRGPKTYYFLLQVDMLGIWVSQSFGAMPMIFATTYCLPSFLKSFLITFYCLLSIWGLYKALTAWSPWERRLCFLLPFIMRILLWCLRITTYGGGDPAAFLHVILQDVVSITGGAIGALHIPEKWFPGSVDLYLNSHNIMHIMVVAAVYFMHTATMRDLTWMSRVDCSAAL